MAGTHFIILKVNGVDVSEMPHEAAVQMFLKASEPILVEVRRRSYKTNDDSSEYPTSNQCYSRLHEQQQQQPTTTMSLMTYKQPQPQPPHHQEEAEAETALASASSPTATATVDSLNLNSLVISSSSGGHHGKHKPHLKPSGTGGGSPNRSSGETPPIKSIKSSPVVQSKTQSPLEESTVIRSSSFVSVGIQTENFNSDFIFNGTTILDEEQIIENDNLFSECLAPEIDIEEITLRKSEGNERLGLTVCYSSGGNGGGNGSGSDDTDTCTEVYISDIVPDSIAGRDGRLRQGDQILQVNGKDVTNKEETETLIAENYNAVTLLVSRYLYGDDDEDQGDFYEDDDPNMDYANCFLDNYVVGECEEENVIKSSQEEAVVAVAEESNRASVVSVSVSEHKDPLNHQSIRAHLDQVNQEIAILDSRVENMMMPQKKNTPEPLATPPSLMAIMEYDTEHIYETIPEDSESEPFYCSPYESSEHHNRIEQWLYMQNTTTTDSSAAAAAENRIRHLKQNHHLQHSQYSHETKAGGRNGTLQSTNSSIGDDHENSSSAYNTGGSCNSNTMTPLTLELNGDRKFNHHSLHNHHSQSTLVLCPPPAPPKDDRLPQQHSTNKEKPLSPSHEGGGLAKPPLRQRVLPSFLQQQKSAKSISAATSNTMYTNVANLQQTMLLQQQLFRQALIQQQLPAAAAVSNSTPCPQFTAPNLSQYHFVSSQEVSSSVKLNTHSNDDHMVWKVKRRPDGTRYIVRRPAAARNRFLRNRAMRITAERNNDQTTEDDTISEIKTGRYWTKEERKKHIERARERRQRQQIIITNKNNEISMQPPPSATMMASSSISLSGDTTIRQPAAAVNGTSGKGNRQKLTKKTTNSSPTVVDVVVNSSPAASVSGTTSIASQQQTTTSTTTTTTAAAGSGNRMNLNYITDVTCSLGPIYRSI